MRRNIGVLHPGAMGATVAQTLLDSGHRVGGVSTGRSEASAQRAGGCRAFLSLDEIASWADALISVCPPHGAFELAERVHATGFTGFYIDANALAPATSLKISEIVGAGAYVDGGIIGPPATRAGTTRLYLSGQQPAGAAAWFSAGALQAIALPLIRAINLKQVAASMLKMSYAAYSKGASALLLSINALAEVGGVTKALRSDGPYPHLTCSSAVRSLRE